MSKVRERAANARYIARHPVKMVRYSATSTRWHNWRNGAAIERGRAPRLNGAIAAVTSRTPVVRDRINPATGRCRRDDAMMHRSGSDGLARTKAARERDPQWWPPAAWERARDSAPQSRPARTRGGR